MSKELELLTEIRDLLQVMAEPALAQRDNGYRDSIRLLVGKADKKARAVLCMDGSMSQAAIVKQTGIDQGGLSRLVKALEAKSLLVAEERNPKLRIKLPRHFFDQKGTADE